MRSIYLKIILSDFFIFLRTILSLKLSQLIFRIYYLLKRSIYSLFKFRAIKTTNYNIIPRDNIINLEISNYKGDINLLLKYNFTFLNKSIKFKNTIEWNNKIINKGTRLWKLNLHYQEYLIDISNLYLQTKNKKLLSFIETTINSWVSENLYHSKENFKASWNSYSVSLRLMTYIEVYCLLKNHITDKKKLLNIILNHHYFLKNNIEYDLRGNHLFENFLALTNSSIFLKLDNDFNMFSTKLKKEIKNQILNDGAHYELSSMYHGIILKRLIKTNLFLNANNLNIELEKFIFYYINLMMNWIIKIQISNNIPLLNDSTPEHTLNLHDLNQIYYKAFKEKFILDSKFKLKESGYRKFVNSKYEALIDVGNIGPKEQTGHSHADTFNTIISINKTDLFIDPGISTYNKSFIRDNERSSSYHNTITLDNFNSSEIWSSFRVGKKCKVNLLVDKEDYVEASHDGYSLQNVLVKRKWKFNTYSIIIHDYVKNAHKISSQTNWLISPNREYVLNNNTMLFKDCSISFFANKIEIIEETIDIPRGFNRLIKTKRIVIRFDTKLKTIITLNKNFI